MSGDRLTQIEELRRKGQLGAITVSDVLALVEIANAAREFVEDNKSDVAQPWDDLAEALARLDSGAAEEDA